MLVKTVFYRELVTNAVRILIILTIILPVTELFKLLDQAVSGNIPSITLLTLALYGTLASFPMILNLSSFLAIVITINRYSKDHEMVIWSVSGLSPFNWLRKTAVFVMPIAIICGICSLLITPWAVFQSQQYAKFLIKQTTPMLLSAGVFRDSPDGKQIYYVEKYSLKDGYVKNIFLQYKDESNTTYNITASEGKIYNHDGLITLKLYNGNCYQLDNLTKQIITMNFATFTISLAQAYDPQRDRISPSSQSYSTLDLIKFYKLSPNNRSELSGRIAIMIMTFVMGLIAVPISIQTSRIQGSLVFIFPPLLYGIYQNVIMTINAQINDEKLYSALWTMPVHLFLLSLALGLTYIKSKPTGYYRLFNK